VNFSSTFDPGDGAEPAQCTSFYTNMVSITCNENVLSTTLEARTKVSQCIIIMTEIFRREKIFINFTTCSSCEMFSTNVLSCVIRRYGNLNCNILLQRQLGLVKFLSSEIFDHSYST
jgi:hypothetical protein